MRFSITTVPCSQICLVSFLASRAFADRAFEAEFVSPDQVLHPGPLEHGVDYVPLRWKPEIFEKGTIIPISYNSYYKLWHRTCFIAGLRGGDKMRPYAMRVGSGNRLDGKFSKLEARNYSTLTIFDNRKPDTCCAELYLRPLNGDPRKKLFTCTYETRYTRNSISRIDREELYSHIATEQCPPQERSKRAYIYYARRSR